MIHERIRTELRRLAPSHKTGTVEIKPQSIMRHAELREQLAAATSIGWVCFTDCIAWRLAPAAPWVHLVDGRTEERLGLADKRVLSAELALTADTSIHVRQDGAAWHVTRLIDRFDSGDDYAFDHPAPSTIPNGPDLCYRVWWRAKLVDGLRVWRPDAARFVGWKEKA